MPPVHRPPPQWALWNLGFRPFYLAAGILAVVAMAVWTAHFAGWLTGFAYLAHPYWHAHEMIFGYALAVMAGFLFTAVRNWTNLPTPGGARLAAIIALWIAARLLIAASWTWVAAVADTAFVLAVAAGIAFPLIASGNRRNLFFVVVLIALGAANLAFHLAMSGHLAVPARDVLQLALDTVAFIMTVIGGRVIPMFTANAAPHARPVRNAMVERMAPASMLALLLAEAAGLPAVALAAIAAAGALAHGWRLALWRPLATRRVPLLWILHAAYAWLVLYLALRALQELGAIAPGIAVHALTVGALGGLTLGMMTRTARGHTGLPLEAGRMETSAYVLINFAAIARVIVPLAAPALYRGAVIVSGLLWIAAFAAFVVKFAPILARPRVDGRPG